MLIPVSLVLLLIAGGGSAYAYMQYRQSPERVLPKMFTAMRTVSAMSLVLDAEVTATGIRDEEEGVFTAGARVEGVTSFEKHPSMQMQLTIDGSSQIGEEETRVFSLGLEQRTQGKEATFLKITNLPPIPLPMVGSMEQFEDILVNRWIAVGGTRAVTDLLGADVAEKIDAFTESRTPSDEDIADVIDKLSSAFAGVVDVTETKGVDEVDRKQSYGYAFTFDKEAFFDALYDISATDPEKYPEDDIDKLEQKAKYIKNITGEIWVDVTSFYVNRFDVSFDAVSTEDGGLRADVAISLQPKGYNMEVAVEAPEDAVTLAQLMQEMVEKFMGEAEALRADDDADGLSFEDETVYGTDPANPDTDGDGFMDGVEVDGGYDPNGPGKLVRKSGPLDAEDILGGSSMSLREEDFSDTAGLGE